jgi:hypothetical protein
MRTAAAAASYSEIGALIGIATWMIVVIDLRSSRKVSPLYTRMDVAGPRF